MPDWELVRSERRAKNPGIRKEEEELKLDSWMQIKRLDGTKESEVVQCSWLGDLQHSIEEPCESQLEERRQEQGTVVKGKRKEI